MSELYRGLTIPTYADIADAPAAFKSLIDSGPIPRFADASARDAAIPTPLEGDHCYLISSHELQVYNGTAWAAPYLKLAGGSLSGQLNMGTNKIINVGDPTAALDAVNKQWVEANVAVTGHPHDAGAITTGILPVARIPDLDAAKIISGVLAIARIPTGTSSTTVAVGNHNHDAAYYTEAEVNTKLDEHFGYYSAHATTTPKKIFIQAGTPAGPATYDIWFDV